MKFLPSFFRRREPAAPEFVEPIKVTHALTVYSPSGQPYARVEQIEREGKRGRVAIIFKANPSFRISLEDEVAGDVADAIRFVRAASAEGC